MYNKYKIDPRTGIRWCDYKSLVKQIFPNAGSRWLLENGIWGYFIHTGESDAHTLRLYYERHESVRYLGKHRQFQETAWKSAYLELKKLGAYDEC